ncbi:SRPBCC family protein [Aquimarina sp. 2201CG14-23]|uniref:SRPBCC family protein n=1 Tax=Aquimarina mycalae TaxID=3040073 RepID=UPI002477F470|nr:SRPBCC family protein [Aquimarina sp. 2201CG14-23]MDH7445972.1 SRPBCC family protein [Aquimarina sp. 2201CG14-23]
MKKLAILLILFVSSTIMLQAQTPLVTEIESSADKVWEQIRKMDNIDELSSFVSKVQWKGPKGIGGERVCTSADGKGHFKEKITGFDDKTRTYSYQVIEGVPAKNMNNMIMIVDLGYKKSMIVWKSNYDFVENPNMTKDQFDNFITTAREEMIENIAKLSK